MGLLKQLRSRSRLRGSAPTVADAPPSPPLTGAVFGYDFTRRLPDTVLANIFAQVCPHTQDETYEVSEKSPLGDDCMLCDLRDLGACARVCRRWCASAQRLLYRSIRIDAVHYCALEEQLADKRRKAGKHFRSKSNVDAADPPTTRLRLLCRTVREQHLLAARVLLLKLPYMTRETAKADLAMTVNALPNLRYVDLPETFFHDDPSCLTLRQELQASCPDIRKMIYRAGSEDSLQALVQRFWQSLESLILDGITVEPTTLRIVLANLPTLKELTFSNTEWLEDSTFTTSAIDLPEFPPLESLTFVDTPNVTAQGLQMYLEPVYLRETLLSITLQNTGVTVQDLPGVLAAATSLRHLSITEAVSKSLALVTHETPPLASSSLTVLHFEITQSGDIRGLQKPTESYYSHLASSIRQNSLPRLRTLYVRDLDFVDTLTLTAPQKPFASSYSPRNSHSPSRSPSRVPASPKPFLQPPGKSRFTQPLEIFSKGADELEWILSDIAPAPPSPMFDRRASTHSGISAPGISPKWAPPGFGFGSNARASMVVGNGHGGFLEIPQEDMPRRPRTMDGRFGMGIEGGDHLVTKSAGTQSGAGDFLKPPPTLGMAPAGDRRSRQDLWR